LEKIVELLLYLAHKKPGADKYQAVKFLYLADREHFNRYGRPITFEQYYALSYGPVASNALDLLNGNINAFKAVGIADIPFELEATSKTTYIKSPKREVNFDLFSKSDVKVFDEVLEQFGNFSFDELFKLTHDHDAYKRAWNNKPFFSRRAYMKYEDILEDENACKTQFIEDLEPISENIK
jgi:uncharacterized phage-associated protein